MVNFWWRGWVLFPSVLPCFHHANLPCCQDKQVICLIDSEEDLCWYNFAYLYIGSRIILFIQVLACHAVRNKFLKKRAKSFVAKKHDVFFSGRVQGMYRFASVYQSVKINAHWQTRQE